MPERQQVLDQPARTADAVAEDDVGLRARHPAIDENERNAELLQPPQVRERPVADGSDQGALDAMCDQR